MTRAEYCRQWQISRIQWARKTDAKAVADFEAFAKSRRGNGIRTK